MTNKSVGSGVQLFIKYIKNIKYIYIMLNKYIPNNIHSFIVAPK